MTIPSHPYKDLIQTVASEYPGLDARVFEAMIYVESGFDPKARSASDAIGLGQIIVKWHEPLIRKIMVQQKVAGDLALALYNPEVNLRVSAAHLMWCYSECKDWIKAVRKYHSGSCDPPTDFVDGQGTSSDAHIFKLLAALEEPEETPMATHRFILSAGHRNTNGGGAHREIDWTYPSVVALKKEIVKRGGQAWIVQEEDGDSDPSFFKAGGLQQAAMRCVALADKLGPFDAYISSHYDSSPGFHAIFPDSPTGGVDVKANNPLDVALCRKIRDRVRATGTVPMKSWVADSPGVMSEKETHVGSQGYRLGEFYGTLGFRATTARVILEASGTGDPYLWKEGWVENVYAPAVVDGLEEVFGQFSEPQVDPVPVPSTEFAKPIFIPGLESLPPYHEVKDKDGKLIAQLVRVDYKVKAIRDTPRLQIAAKNSRRVEVDVKEGAIFEVSYLILNTDGTKYWYSPYASRFRFEDAVPYFADVDD